MAMTPMPRFAASVTTVVNERQAMHVGGVQGDEHGVEIEAAHRLEQDRGIVMPRDTQMLDATLSFRLHERLESAALAEDARQVVVRAQIVQLPQVEVIGASALQALFEQLERAVARAVVRLGREENLTAPFAERRAIVIETAGVRGRSVAIGDALVERTTDDARGRLVLAPRAQDAFAAEAEERDLAAGFASQRVGIGSGIDNSRSRKLPACVLT